MKIPPLVFAGCLAFLQAGEVSSNLFLENPTPKDILNVFSKSSAQPESFRFTEPGGQIRLVKTGNSRSAWVVFVHGSPGDWEAFSSYLTNGNLLSRAALVSVDRPGFGGSDPGAPERSVKIQSDRIHRAFRELSLRANQPAKAVWVGHSYGGPVIARLAMDHPETVRGLLFIGAPFDPELEVVEWYQKVGAKPCVSRFLPKIIYVVNEELFPLKSELQIMLPLWKTIRSPATVLHGTKDRLVPFGNTAFATSHLVSADLREVVLTNVDHFIPWTHRQVVEAEILRLLEK